MLLEGSFTISAPRESVWYCLREPTMLVQAVPGCQFWQIGLDHLHRSSVSARIGPIHGLMNNTLRLDEGTSLNQYQFDFQSDGSPGQIIVSGTMTLEENGRFSTSLTYTADVQVTGRLAGLGDRFIITSIKSLFRQTLSGIEQQLTGQSAASPLASPAATHPVQHESVKFIKPVLLLIGALILFRLLARKKQRV